MTSIELVPSDHHEQLLKTHRFFFESTIIASTDKAFQVAMKNNEGTTQVYWFPKSKMKYREIKVTQQYLFYHTGETVPNPEFGKMRKQFYIPKFFTK